MFDDLRLGLLDFEPEGVGLVDIDGDGWLDLIADNDDLGFTVLRNLGASWVMWPGLLPDSGYLGGEYLALVRPDGTVASEFAPTYPPQRRDVSYGAEGFFLTPTPGEPNTTTVEGFVSEPEFSAGRGFYDGPVNVTLSSATPDVTFRYTTDGTPPSPTYGTEYDGPIWVDTTTTLRVIGIKPDFGPSRVVTHTL